MGPQFRRVGLGEVAPSERFRTTGETADTVQVLEHVVGARPVNRLGDGRNVRGVEVDEFGDLIGDDVGGHGGTRFLVEVVTHGIT